MSILDDGELDMPPKAAASFVSTSQILLSLCLHLEKVLNLLLIVFLIIIDLIFRLLGGLLRTLVAHSVQSIALVIDVGLPLRAVGIEKPGCLEFLGVLSVPTAEVIVYSEILVLLQVAGHSV